MSIIPVRTFVTAVSAAFLFASLPGCTESETVSTAKSPVEESLSRTTDPPAAASTPSVQPTTTPAPAESTKQPAPEAEPLPEPSAATEPTASEPSTDGVWKIKSAVLAGTPLPALMTDTITLKLSGADYLVTVDDKPDKGTCKLDRAIEPHQMTITGTEGPNAGKTFLAVFDFPDASTMRVSYDLTGAAFPNSFDSTAENNLYSVTYNRQPE